MTEQLLTCGRVVGVKLHTHMHIDTHTHTHIHYNQSHPLIGWAWQLEICGSLDHLELFTFLIVPVSVFTCLCVGGVSVFSSRLSHCCMHM